MKRAVSLILATLCIFSLFSCNKKEPEPSDEIPSGVTEPATLPPENTEPTEPTEPAPTVPPLPVENYKTTEINISFVGDCLLGNEFGSSSAGTYNAAVLEKGQEFAFAGVKHIFEEDDLTVADCEGVFTDNKYAPIQKEEDPGYWYYAPAVNAGAFKLGGVDIAGTANNHTGDYGAAGLADTISALEDAGVLAANDLEPVYVQIKGFTVGVLACNCWGSFHASRIIDKISEMNEKSDIQVIFPHGGNMLQYYPEEWKKQAYRSFIDAGADIVAGDHPHVLQPIEAYGDGVIIYSLGNFIYGGKTGKEKESVIFRAKVIMHDDEIYRIEHEAIPCYMYITERNSFTPYIIPPTDEAYDNIISFLYGKRDYPF